MEGLGFVEILKFIENMADEIKDLNTPWEGFSGAAVEKFIKKLFGSKTAQTFQK